MKYEETIYPDRVIKFITLEGGESIPNPTRPGRNIYGPQTIKQTIWNDGGVDIKLFYEPEEENQE